MNQPKIVYNDYTYVLGTANKYFYATKNGKNVALHRQVWIDNFGNITKGFHIHHKDGDTFNNNIENLECLSPKEHHEIHWSKSKEERMPWLLKFAEIGREYAKEWHGSHTGKKWHYRHYEDVADKLHKVYERQCSNCQKPMSTNRKNENCFCCGYCKIQFRDKRGIDNETRVCENCKLPFSVNKYRKVRFCSIKCKPAPNPFGRIGKPKI